MTSKRFFDLVLDKSEMPKNWSVGKPFFDIKHLYDATFSVLNRSATKNWCWKISIWPQFYWNDHIFSLSDNPGHNILALLSKLANTEKLDLTESSVFSSNLMLNENPLICDIYYLSRFIFTQIGRPGPDRSLDPKSQRPKASRKSWS